MGLPSLPSIILYISHVKFNTLGVTNLKMPRNLACLIIMQSQSGCVTGITVDTKNAVLVSADTDGVYID